MDGDGSDDGDQVNMGSKPKRKRSLVKEQSVVEGDDDPDAGSSSSSAGRKSKKKKSAEKSGGEDDVVSTITTTEQGTTGLVLTEGTDDEEWLVEKVLKKHVDLDKKVWYQIKWEGWDSKFNTWEPLEHLENSMDLVEQFEERKKLKKLQATLKKKLRAALKKKSKNSEEDPVPAPLSRMEVDPSGVASCLDYDSQESVEESQHESILTSRTPTRMNETMKVNENDTICNLEEDEESSKLESEDDETEMEVQRWLHGPQFRRLWRKEETPLAIVGSAIYHNILVHLIRLWPPSDKEAEQVLEDPLKGLNPQNFVYIPSSNFSLRYPEMLIEYYEKCSANTNSLPSSSSSSSNLTD